MLLRGIYKLKFRDKKKEIVKKESLKKQDFYKKESESEQESNRRDSVIIEEPIKKGDKKIKELKKPEKFGKLLSLNSSHLPIKYLLHK